MGGGAVRGLIWTARLSKTPSYAASSSMGFGIESLR